MTALFRLEALDGQRKAWLGSVRLYRPLSLGALTAFAVSIAAVTVVYGYFGEFTRKATVNGILVSDPGTAPLVLPQAATVAEIQVREGQAADQGEPLFALATDPATPSAVTPTAGPHGLVVRERSPAALTREAKEAVDRDAGQRIVIRAPQGGLLRAVKVEPQQRISPAAALTGPAPAQARLQAQLYAPASVVGFLRIHHSVLLRFQAFPHQKYGHYSGQILHVARTPLAAGELSALSLATVATSAGADVFGGRPNPGEPLYRIIVALDQQGDSSGMQALPLATGMRLEADVALDRRRLIDWLFEPVFGRASGG